MKRELLLQLLAQGRDTLDSDSLQLLSDESNYQHICDLIHSQFVTATIENRFMKRDYMSERSQAQIMDLLEAMQSEATFRTFFVNDLLQRSKNFIQAWIDQD